MGRVLFTLIFGLTGLAILVSLGMWQLQRLTWKEGVLADIEARISADPVSVPLGSDPISDRYLPVHLTGEMLEGEVHVLVSVKQVGPGYRILAPFVTQDQTLLVDRGFVALEDKDTPRQIGEMEIIGNLHWPDEIDEYTPDPDIDANIWFARDLNVVPAVLGTEPILVIAKSKTDPNVTPLPVDTNGIPNDHLQYVVTWFGLALVWAGMSVYFLWRTRAAKRAES
ncbi:SURF1 family protein [Falsiruegeria litorea]|uniref:SURF1 family protein n=1 Tax=Falsiruegeria litorea TaxID=1280831 RepID=UPI001BFD41FF|nr:SURF1 family protein [Falsiruegeria litorea]MBT8168245.1 SURF1 family protein [Falsiruegeria litorea]